MSFSLQKRPGTPYWHAYIRTPDPDDPSKWRQTTKSTRKTTKKEAEVAARELEAAAIAEAGAGTDKSRAVYALLKDAASLAEAGRLNLAAGRDILSRMIEAAGAGEFRNFTVRQWLERWLATKSEDHAKPGARGRSKGFAAATHLRYQGVIGQFLSLAPAEKVKGDLLALTTDDIRAFRDALAAGGRSAATVNDAVKTIRTALNAARREGILLANPAEAVETLAESEPIRGTFNPEDVSRLLQVADGDWPGAIRFAWFTGASLRDITEMRWSQIDLHTREITYSRRKTGAFVRLPIHDDLFEWLISIPAKDDPEAFLFPGLAGKSTAGKSGLSMKFARLMEKAKIAGEVDEAGGSKGRKRRSLSFHSLRHSFNSAMANAGIAVEVRQKLTGHASAEMNAAYTHFEAAPLRAAVAAVPRLKPETQDE